MRKALVTGGSRGIGRGIAVVLASEGYDIALTYDSKPEEAQEVVDRIRSQTGQRCMAIQAEFSDAAVPRRTVTTAIEELGGIDLLVNNAGYTKFDQYLGHDVDEITRLMHVDFRAYYVAAITVADYMASHGIRGNIVNITSSRAERAYPDDAVYGGMKAAVKRATESLAIRYAPHGVRINCVAPGAISVRDNPKSREFYEALAGRVPLRRIGTPEDIGNAVAWLASDRATYITGITLRVDGGLVLPGMPERIEGNEAEPWDQQVDRSAEKEHH